MCDESYSCFTYTSAKWSLVNMITAVILVGLVVVDMVESLRFLLFAGRFCLFGKAYTALLCLELGPQGPLPTVNLN